MYIDDGRTLKRLRNRLLAFGLGIIFCASLVEVVLVILVSIENHRFVETLKQLDLPDSREDFFHVVVLGESTSQVWGSEVSPQWPKILEGLLNSRARNDLESRDQSRRFRVTSIAQSGHFSTLQVDRLIREFERLRPDAVISMMGINDSLAVHRVEPSSSFRIRSLQLAQWLDIFVICRECKSTTTVEEYRSIANSVDVNFRQKFDQLLSHTNSTSAVVLSLSQLDQIKKSVEDELVRAPQLLAPTLIYSSEVLRSRVLIHSWKPKNDEALDPESRRRMEKALQISRDWYRRVLDEIPNHPLALVGICRPHWGAEQDTLCRDRVFELAQRGDQVPIEVLFLARKQEVGSESRIDPLLRAYGYRVADQSSNSSGNSYLSTRESYQRLAHFLRKAGVIYFAMQYPTGSVNGLKELFFSDPPEGRRSFADAFYSDSDLPWMATDPKIAEEFRFVRYISNANFTQLVAREGESAFFVDMFARRTGLNFGHTNFRGSLEIAINARNALMAELDSRSSHRDSSLKD